MGFILARPQWNGLTGCRQVRMEIGEFGRSLHLSANTRRSDWHLIKDLLAYRQAFGRLNLEILPMLLTTMAVVMATIGQGPSDWDERFPAHKIIGNVYTSAPQAEISNGVLKAQFYLPDAQKGFYRGTRFDWSGVIGNLEYKGHRYYGQWFTKTDPAVNDFIYEGSDIIAGPCSAITGPAEEFSTDDQALGYEEAKPGRTFIKIGVGVLRKPQDGARYSRFRLYELVDPGTWTVRTAGDRIEFTHEIADPSSGYGYRYQKTIQLVPGQPKMVMDHKLKNTGKRSLASSVYNHNFLVLDGQPPGPDWVLKLPFEIKTKHAPHNGLAEVRGNQIVYLRALRDKETVFIPLQGFGPTAADYRFTIENKKTGAGLNITGDRPLSNVVLWSIRSVLSLEPFLAMAIEPGREFTWKYTYTYYLIDGNEK